ncbi:MAG: F0F1 ATP synthase subunit delta [Candidatus Saccharibacteria bacterium]|nr:F0F1 ATP synthase subunit delta [Candidatus Saccharibacteria bacterium]
MAVRVSRRKLAMHAADRLVQGDAAVLDEVAALLKTEKRARDIDLLVAAIEAELAARGVVVAIVESARALTGEARAAVTELVAADADATVQLREVVRPELIGGVKITTPTAVLDMTIAKKLNDLRANNKSGGNE